ncbi:hypothetical protein M9Y10_001474 [Tritrichomonas musculus]|uniref:MatE family protein n=1 Tax=Tritrichomonas musculus TaxID=1915356 RepID=A0ABR2L7H6_9EUKA
MIDESIFGSFYSVDQSKARFQKHSAFITLISMSFGPLVMLVITKVMDFVELFFLTKRFSQSSPIKPVQLQGFSNFCSSAIIIIITYFSTAISTRLGRFIGESRKKDAVQFFTDVTKLGIIFLILSLPFLQFLIYPLLKFMKCPENMLSHCFSLVLITFSSSPFIFLFNISCSFLQSVGRSFLNGLLHIIQSIFQVVLLTPLFLFVFKIDITFISLQWSISQALIGLILFIMIYSNKFGYSVNFSTYPLPVLTATFQTLKNALSSVVSFLCNVTPPIFFMRFLLSTVKSPEKVDSLAGIQSIYVKVDSLGSSVSLAVSIGFLTVGTFDYGAHDNRRLLKCFGFAILISVLFDAVFSCFMIIEPNLISSIYLDSSIDIAFSKKILKIPFYTNWFSSINVMCKTLHLCIGKPLRASFLSFIEAFFLIFFSYVLSIRYTNQPEKVYMTYNISDILLLILSVSLSAGTIHNLRKEIKVHDDTSILVDKDLYEFGLNYRA